MKTYNPICYLLCLACAGLLLPSCQTGPGTVSAPPPNSGHVLIYRVANFGTDLSMVVSVDGKDVGSFTDGNNYDGYLPAGPHHITVRVDPNRTGAGPGRRKLTVQSGQTYSYTAAWSGGNLKLVRNP